MALVTYPLNNVDYQAEDAELFHCTRNSGIFAGDDFACSVTGADNNVTIDIGLGWLRNSRFSGKVIALKSAQTLELGIADSVYPRIDAVVIRFDANANKTEIVVKQGTAASSPTAPAVSRTESLYELHLYHVRREAGASAISAADITDLRLDSDYCGLMADPITPIQEIPEHSHDDRYYTEAEVDSKLNGKANSTHTHNYAASSHSHDDRYYTESEVDSKLSEKANSSHSHDYAASNHSHTAAQVGALPSGGGTVSGALAVTGNVTLNGGYFIGKVGVNIGTAAQRPTSPPNGTVYFRYT